MTTSNNNQRLLRELLKVARATRGPTVTGFEWSQLHQLGRSLGLDAATTEATVARLEEEGALRNKARDWRVMSAHYSLTDVGIQAALRSDRMSE